MRTGRAGVTRTSRLSARGRIEARFEALARRVVRWRWPVAVSLLFVAVALATRVPDMRVEVSTESFLDPGSPTRVVYDEFRQQFDRDDVATLIVEAPEIFDLRTLERLRALHRDIEDRVPHVAEVTSLVNARDTRGDADQLFVDGLLDDWPTGPEELEHARRRALANELYRGTLLGQGGRHTALVILPEKYAAEPADGALAGFDDASAADQDRELLSPEELREMVGVLHRVAAEHDAPGFRVQLAGQPVWHARICDALERDSALFTAISAAAIALLLFVVFRRPSGVVLPLLVVGLALATAQGLQVLLGIPLSTPLEMVPPLLLAVGICSAVHILAIFDQALARGEAKPEAIAHALGHSGLGVLMASLTTALGLSSFLVADLAPVRHLGIVAPIGVALTLVYTLLLLPALLAILPIRPRARPGGGAALVGRVLARAAELAATHPREIAAAGVLVFGIGAAGALQVRFGHNSLAWLPERDPVRVATEVMDRHFAGVANLEVLIDTGAPNGLHEPEALRRLEQAMDRAERFEAGPVSVGKAMSLVDVVQEIHQALNENDPRFHALPSRRELIAQELLLFESSGSDDLADVVDPTFRTARLSLRTPYLDASLYPPFLEALRRDVERGFGPGVEVRVTGVMPLLTESLLGIVRSASRSYALALLLITPTMILLVGDWRRGLLSMLPNLLPVLLCLAAMGYLGIRLDASSVLLGSIVLGLAVDDTIHFFHKFQRYYEDTGDAVVAVQRTLDTTGAALLTTSLVLTCGFLSFAFAYMQNAVLFGLLAAFGIGVALLADVLLAPALVILATGATRSSPALGLPRRKRRFAQVA